PRRVRARVLHRLRDEAPGLPRQVLGQRELGRGGKARGAVAPRARQVEKPHAVRRAPGDEHRPRALSYVSKGYTLSSIVDAAAKRFVAFSSNERGCRNSTAQWSGSRRVKRRALRRDLDDERRAATQRPDTSPVLGQRELDAVEKRD